MCDLLARAALDASNVKMLVLNRFEDVKDVHAWHENLSYLRAALPKVQICVVAENEQVTHTLASLFLRELHHINFCRPSSPTTPLKSTGTA